MTIIAVPYHTDDHIEDFALPVQPDAVLAPELADGSSWSRMAQLYDSLADEVAGRANKKEHVLVLSGDCTTSLGIVAGLQRSDADDVGVVWFDAHGDLQTPRTTTSGYLGGMPLRMLLGTGDRRTIERLGLRPVAEERTVLVGSRDLDPPEREFLASSRVRQLAVADVRPESLPSGPLYLHLDLDVVDPSELPGLLYPAPGGPSMQAVAHAVDTVLSTGRVRAIGLGCTWHPERADAAASVVRLVEQLRDARTDRR